MSTPSSRRSWRSCAALGLAAASIQAALAMGISGAKLRSGTDDTDIYFSYATRTLQGEIPYRDFPVEYPPLALPLFLAPAAASRGVAGFKTAFAVEMLLCNAAAVVLVGLRVGLGGDLRRVAARLAWSTAVFLILSRLVVTRYDAAPMLLGFSATLWWSSGRGALGGAAASLGALMKVFPGVVAPIAAIRGWRRAGPGRGAGAVAFATTSAAGVASWLGIGGAGGVSASLHYHLGRGFEYGSLYSGAQMLAAKLLGGEIAISRDHVSFSSTTAWSPILLRLVLPIQAAALLLVCAVFASRGAREVVRYTGAAVLGFIVAGKVFSPQYLIWMLPYVAVLEGPVARRARWIFASVCAATQLSPSLLHVLPRTSLWAILAYDARNALVVWLWAWMVFGPQAAGPDDGEAAGRLPSPGVRDRWHPPTATGATPSGCAADSRPGG